MATYRKPSKSLHKSFFYLNDEIVVNSLSALEAGKVDEVISKAVVAREGGGSLGANFTVASVGAKAEGSKKGSSTLEEEMTRTRTRFSIFHLWYELLEQHKALGLFEGWGEGALVDVRPGDTVVLHAELEILSMYGLVGMFQWFAEKAGEQGHPFSQKGPELKSTRDTARLMKMFVGGEGHEYVGILAIPEGDAGPTVGMRVSEKWIVGDLSSVTGYYTVVAQVQKVVNAGDWFPMMRLVSGAPVTTVERDAIREMLKSFEDPAASFELPVSKYDGEVQGPAVWLEPIAIYR
ncbi:hypothetical protein [Nocardia sp. NPDC057353]|uniref:DUF6414 family protein n=1 Tax=Nocardia sp. NPDC057353 TaxID=3346104 RepID=UPI0036407C2F